MKIDKYIQIGVFVFSFMVLSHFSFSQTFSVTFKSDTAKSKLNCNFYVSGYANGTVSSNSIQVPGTYSWFKCETGNPLYLSIDCWRGFVLERIANCGDSILINIDTRTYIYLNKPHSKSQ